MSDARVLRTVLDLKREGVTGGWLGDEGVRVIKSRTMRWAGRVAHMEDKRNWCRVLWGNLGER